MHSLALLAALAVAAPIAHAQGDSDLGLEAPHAVGGSLSGAVLFSRRPYPVYDDGMVVGAGGTLIPPEDPGRRPHALFVLAPHARARTASWVESGRVELEARLPIGLYEHWADDGEWNGAFVGNLWLGAAVASRTQALSWVLRLGAAAPLGSLTPLYVYARSPAVAWGSWDRWLFATDVVPVVLSGSIEHRARVWSIGAEAAGAVGIPFDPGRLVPTDRLELYAQLAITVGWRLGDVVWMGLRSQAVVMGAEGDGWHDDWVSDAQLSLAPSVRVYVDDSALELRWLVHVDEPEGPTFSARQTSMALQLQVTTGLR